jgi:hypothetical protein
MVEATTILELQILGARKTLAQASACKAVKRDFQRQGIKLGQLSGREISLAAESYLAHHPELLVEAAERVERWVAAGHFGKRAQLAWSQRTNVVRANLSTDAQNGKA